MARTGSFEYLQSRQSQIDHSVFAGQQQDGGGAVYLSEQERAVHAYLCGVSGSGKSRFLQNLILQDVSKGHPLCLIDPMGDLYRSALEIVATGLERSSELGFERSDLLQRYLFLDGTDEENPLRINPLEPQGDETSEQQVDDLMKALERLFEGKLEEQRKLRNVLRATFMLIAELNRLPDLERPLTPEITADDYPLNLFWAPHILNMHPQERAALLAVLPDTARMLFHRQYWEFLALNTQHEKNQLVQSSWNVLQYLLADDLVLRVFNTRHSTLDFSELLRDGVSLFCFFPINENLAGARFLGKYFTTKLQHCAYRRAQAEWRHPYYLYLDEFHQFVDQAFADAMTNLRKFGIRVTNAHQSQSQPPFDTVAGQSLLRTIKANSRVRVLFRLDRSDAEEMSKELFALTQRRENFQTTDHSVGHSEQHSSGTTHSSGQTRGSGRSSASSHASNTGRNDSVREDHSGDLLGSESTSAGSSVRRDTGLSEHSGFSTGIQASESTSVGDSISETTRSVYYTPDGERELLVNLLQRLEDRQCYLSTAALASKLIETPYVPDSHYAYVAENFPARLLQMQRDRMEGGTTLPDLVLRPVQLLPAAVLSDIEIVAPARIVFDEESREAPVAEESVLVVTAENDDDPFLD